jgi:nitrate reductase alpha subunit
VPRRWPLRPDYAEISKLADLWMHPKQGTDAAVAMAMGHVILKEFYFDKRSSYFDDYVRRYTDMPNLVQLEEHTLRDGRKVLVPGQYLRASDFNGKLGQDNNPEWKTVAIDDNDKVVLPNGSIGFRWGAEGRADVGKVEPGEQRSPSWQRGQAQAEPDGGCRRRTLTVGDVGFPYFGGIDTPSFRPTSKLRRHRRRAGAQGACASHRPGGHRVRPDRGQLRRRARPARARSAALSYDDDVPYTPAWQEKITGVI